VALTLVCLDNMHCMLGPTKQQQHAAAVGTCTVLPLFANRTPDHLHG
jgi:hypothetical protein